MSWLPKLCLAAGAVGLGILLWHFYSQDDYDDSESDYDDDDDSETDYDDDNDEDIQDIC